MNQVIYHVTFPHIGLDFQISPVAFTVFGMDIYWYGVIIAVGFALAAFYVYSQCKKVHIDVNSASDAIFVGLFCAIIGARLYYVIFDPSGYFFEHPLEIVSIHKGGLAIYGGIIGGLLGGGITARKKRIPLRSLFDIIMIGFLIGQSIGRWGNFTNQEAFGTVTDFVLGMSSEATNNLTVHPCFLYESIWCLVGALVLHIFNTKYKKYDGQNLLLYLIWYGSERFFLEGIRTDSLYIPFMHLRISQVVAFVTVIVSIGLMIYMSRKLKGVTHDEHN